MYRWFIDVEKFLGGGWWMVCGVGKMIENEFSVQTDYEWIDTGTIWYKWWRTEGGRDRVKFRDAIASKQAKNA